MLKLVEISPFSVQLLIFTNTSIMRLFYQKVNRIAYFFFDKFQWVKWLGRNCVDGFVIEAVVRC